MEMDFILILVGYAVAFIVGVLITRWIFGITKSQAHMRAQTQLLMYIAARAKHTSPMLMEDYKTLNEVIKANGISDEIKLFKEGMEF